MAGLAVPDCGDQVTERLNGHGSVCHSNFGGEYSHPCRARGPALPPDCRGDRASDTDYCNPARSAGCITRDLVDQWCR